MQRGCHRTNTSTVVFAPAGAIGEVVGSVSAVGVEVKPIATYFLRFAGVAGFVADSVGDAAAVPDWVRT
jgi:hypothetical protein